MLGTAAESYRRDACGEEQGGTTTWPGRSHAQWTPARRAGRAALFGESRPTGPGELLARTAGHPRC